MKKSWTEATLEFAGIPEKIVRGTLLGLTSRIVKRSPVDTGRFRNNWNASINSMNQTTTETVDRSGASAINKARATINALEMGSTFYLSNNLPYSQRLEYGWSDQAPSGMLRISVAELQARMNEANK
jgi:hypothetical protein